MVTDQQVIQYFRNAIETFAKEQCSVDDWGKNFGDNEIKAMELREALEDKYKGKLFFLKKEADIYGFEVQITIGNVITHWKDFHNAINQVIRLVSEQFLIVQIQVEEDYLKYWFATGVFSNFGPHGHIGALSIKIDDIRHLQPWFLLSNEGV